MVLIPGSGKSPGGGRGNPLQYSCLENSMDRGAWWATVHGVTQSQTGLKRLNTHTHTHTHSLFTSSRKSVRAVTLTAGRQAICNNFQVVILPFAIQGGLGESPRQVMYGDGSPFIVGTSSCRKSRKPCRENSIEQPWASKLLGHLVNPVDSYQDDVTISASGPQVACQYLPVHHPQQMNEVLLFTMWKASLVHHPFSD